MYSRRILSRFQGQVAATDLARWRRRQPTSKHSPVRCDSSAFTITSITGSERGDFKPELGPGPKLPPAGPGVADSSHNRAYLSAVSPDEAEQGRSTVPRMVGEAEGVAVVNRR